MISLFEMGLTPRADVLFYVAKGKKARLCLLEKNMCVSKLSLSMRDTPIEQKSSANGLTTYQKDYF